MKRFICELPETVQKAIENRAREFYKDYDFSDFDDMTNCLDDLLQTIMSEKIVNVWYSADCDDVIMGRAFPIDDLVPWGTFY